MDNQLRVTSASWNGAEGATHFTFSDGSHGVQHFSGSGGLRFFVGELHNVTPEQQRAIVRWNNLQNAGKGNL